MIIEKVKELTGAYDAVFLYNNYAICNFFYVGSKFVAIITRGNYKIENCGRITVKETRNKPLWKQHMQLSMGVAPKPDVIRGTYRARELSPMEIKMHRFEVYREI